ncbi:unnamed protein product [Urochloa humidicola]
MSLHAYSSETGAWTHCQIDVQEDQGQLEDWRPMGTRFSLDPHYAFVNGMLHLAVLNLRQRQMVAVDVQGKTRRIITTPSVANRRHWKSVPYFGQSQGRLHYISQEFDAYEQSYEMFIWFLQDYDTHKWVLKDTVSFLKLFGKNNYFHVVAIHQDCNVVFFIQPLNFELMAYDMDSKEVSVVTSFEKISWHIIIAPYIPYFSESPVLRSKQ